MRKINFIFITSLFCLSLSAYANTNLNAVVYTKDKTAVVVKKDQPEFTIKLKANPTTGYTWALRDYDAKLIEPLHHVYIPPQGKKLMQWTQMTQSIICRMYLRITLCTKCVKELVGHVYLNKPTR